MECLEQNNEKIHKIGIIGGTFDPIHYGHLVAAEWARDTFSLDKVLFIPAGHPPHKEKENVLSAEHRYNMTVLATVEHPYFQVSSMEIERGGSSYTVDTINALKAVYGADTDLYFITGADSVLDLFTWKRYEELLQSCYFIAATRQGYDLHELNEKIKEIHCLFGKKIFKMEIPALGISSTELRRRRRDEKSIKYLLPPSVEQYIIKNKLYQSLGGS